MKHIQRYFLLLSLLFIQVSLFAQIPASRVMDWSTVGMQGGITTYPTIKNFLNHGGVVNNTAADNTPALQNLINTSAGSGTVIYFPQGTYRFKGKINIPSQGKIILRGEDAANTIFQFETGDMGGAGNIEMWGGYNAGPFNVVSGCTKDSKQLTLNNVTGLKVGDWIDISQENDASVMSTNNPSNALTEAPRAVGQLMKITAINAKTLTLDRPLHYTYNLSLTVQVNRMGVVEGVGFEKFTLQSLLGGNKSHFLFTGAVNCWMKCVRSIKSVNSHVNASLCANLTIRDSYFYNSYEFGSGGRGYGVALSTHTTDVLVENNIFDRLRHAMLVQRGANGNVFGYNYSINATSDGSISSFNRITDVSLHGHFPHMNLFEGNLVQEIHSADTWGPSGNGNTFFRNKVTREGIRISDKSIEQNVIGNDLIKDGTASFTSNTIVNESGVINTLIHGNKVNGTVSWNSSLGSNNVIQSYYLSGKPAFFGAVGWPIFGPGAVAGTLPAQDRNSRGAYTECVEISNAKFISQAIPTQVTPGSVTNVSVTLQNTGTTTWVYGNSTGFKLGFEDPITYKWNAGRVLLPKSTVNPGEQVTFNFPITAPNQAGTYDYQMQMVNEWVEWFGDKTPLVKIQVGAPAKNATVVYHNVSKTKLQPGESFLYEITFKNTGNITWKKGSYFIGTKNPDLNMTWGANKGGLPRDIIPGDQMVFQYTLKAPATPGIYNLQTQMLEGTASWFGETTPNVVMTVGTLNSMVTYHNVSSTTLQPGESFLYEITFKNTGTITWKQGDFFITTKNPDLNKTWGGSKGGVPHDIAPGGQVVYQYNLKAPLTPGTYNLQTQMMQGTNNWFGELTPNVVMQVSVGSALMPIATSIIDATGEEGNVTVYPNPSAENIFNITNSDGTFISSIEIMDLNGKQVFNQLINEENNVIIQPELSQGTYTLRVITGKTVYVNKIMKL